MRTAHLLVVALLLAGCKQRLADSTVKADDPPADVNFDNQTNLFPNYTIYDHGKECFEAMDQKPFPEINCLDGALLPTEVDGAQVTDRIPEKCDKPDLVDPALGCVPGSRIRKVVDGDVTTLFMCRRLPRLPVWPVTSAMTHNIAMYQYNKRTGDVCWFQIRAHETGLDGTRVPAPYKPGRVAGDADDQAARRIYVEPGRLIRGDACVRCHDSQLFLRTPFVSQAKYSSRPEDRANAVPDTVNHGRLRHVGLAFASWNGDDAQPYRFRIQQEAYDRAFPPTADVGEGADACTECHAIGKSRFEHADPSSKRGTCNNLLKAWTHPGTLTEVNERWLSETGKSAVQVYWMPPGVARDMPDPAAWPSKYGRAIEALKRCCENPDLAHDGQRLCY